MKLLYRSLTLVLIVVLLSATFALIASMTAILTPPLYWKSTDNGLLTNVEALASAPNILYAGAWGQSITRSTDHGATWQPANTGITLPLHIQGGLAVNSVTPTQVFAGDIYGGGLYHSNNGGIAWQCSYIMM